MSIKQQLSIIHSNASMAMGALVAFHLTNQLGDISINKLDIGVGDVCEVQYGSKNVEISIDRVYQSDLLVGVILQCKDIPALKKPFTIKTDKELVDAWDDVVRSYYLYKIACKPVNEIQAILGIINSENPW